MRKKKKKRDEKRRKEKKRRRTRRAQLPDVISGAGQIGPTNLLVLCPRRKGRARRRSVDGRSESLALVSRARPLLLPSVSVRVRPSVSSVGRGRPIRARVRHRWWGQRQFRHRGHVDGQRVRAFPRSKESRAVLGRVGSELGVVRRVSVQPRAARSRIRRRSLVLEGRGGVSSKRGEGVEILRQVVCGRLKVGLEVTLRAVRSDHNKKKKKKARVS